MDKFQRCVFPAITNRRLSELSATEKENAYEDWIRANHVFATSPEHIAFLLRRIDTLRTDANIAARAMRDAKPRSGDPDFHECLGQWETDCETLSIAFQQRSPTFDRIRFLKDCGSDATDPWS